jgi:hypothetical protein
LPKFVLNLFVGRFVRRPLSRLTDMARRPAALVGAVGVTALAALLAVVLLSRTGPAALLQPDFFFGDSGAVGRMQALAGAEASMGKSGAGVKALLKRELNNQVHAREAHRYAHALQMGGLQVDPAAEKTIMTAFRRVKRGAASLAVSGKLQKQVVLAGAISRGEAATGARRARARRAPAAAARSDKLRLAEAIMAGTSGPTGGTTTLAAKGATRGTTTLAAKGATRPAAKHAALQRKKTSFKSQMKAQLAAKTSAMEKTDLRADLHHGGKAQPAALKPLKGAFALQMMAQLNQKAQHMASSAWHSQVKAVSTQDLATAQWDSAKQAEAQGMGTDTTLSHGRDSKPALTVGSSSDDTELSVSDGAHADRLRLEKEMEQELNSKASSLERKNFNAIARASMPKASEHKETDFVKKEAKLAASQPRSRLEQTLEKSIRSIDNGREETLYHAGLVKEGFDGAVVSSKALDH